MVAKVKTMADELVKYAKRHGKLIATIIASVFVMGGMFYTARADMESIKDTQPGCEHWKQRQSQVIPNLTTLLKTCG